jgi:hypothetical protein
VNLLLFIPESMSQYFQKFSRQESVLFLAQESNKLPEIISSIESLLKQEGFERFEISSPIKWLGELDGVRNLRIQAQAIGGSFVGLLHCTDLRFDRDLRISAKYLCHSSF